MPDYGGFMGPTYGVGGMSRAKKTAQKRLARLLRGRTEPHGIEITDESILKGVEVDDSGIVRGRTKTSLGWFCKSKTPKGPPRGLQSNRGKSHR